MAKRTKANLNKRVKKVRAGVGIAIQGGLQEDVGNSFALKTWLEEVLQALSLGEQTFKQNFMQLVSAADRCCAYFDGIERSTGTVEKAVWFDSDVTIPSTLPEAANVIGDQIKSLLRSTFATQSRLARQLTELQNHIFGNAEDLSDLSDPHYANDFFEDSNEKDSGIIPTRVVPNRMLETAGTDIPPGGSDGRAVNRS